jgi:LAO/AO transport system kinase
MTLAEIFLSSTAVSHHWAGSPGERLALAKLLSQIENRDPSGQEALGQLFPHTGRAHLVGVTGAPGTGKSSLVNRLAYHYRHPPQGETPCTVAVVAVDPSSPFTGGAILGDRVRMRDLAGDPGVFIRSMAARGSLGGLAPATASVAQAFDAAGFEIVLIETVGAGQAEVDVARLAHTTVVVEAPGMGDEVQAIKAGILEIADILVVNKADRPGVENTVRGLRGMLELGVAPPRSLRSLRGHHGFDFGTDSESIVAPPAPAEEVESWTPPILRTVATEGDGVPELAVAIARHRVYLQGSGNWERRDRARLQAELEALVGQNLVARWRETVSPARYMEILNRLAARQLSPHQAAVDLLDGGERA